MTTSFELSADVALFGQPLTLEVDSGSGRATIEVAEPPSLAEIIESFAGLVVPGFTLQVPAPWDSLVAIKLPAITFELTAETIGFTVDGPWTVVPGILEVGSFGLTYTKDTGGDGDGEETGLSISLGITLLGENLDEVVWDPIEEPVPPVDPKGGRFFELTYVGLGQRQRFEPASPTASPQNMDEVMALLMTDPSPLRYDADSGWLFGTRFTVLDTVDLDLVFWDPHLYGLAAKLRGEKAGSLDGLRFEILYRKINEHLGVYHAELELPTAMRRLELGAVSATLPAAIVDIYTDGSFLIDLGFPHNLDFTRSAQVEVFPFLGRGGFYVGVLPADAVPELPSVPANTRFGPVVAVGLGVEVGVGKTIEMGALSAGATVTMVGTFEGLLAPFLDEGGEHAGLYYRVSAVVGLVGHIYGSVNFGVVQAQVDLVATATATVTIEAHRPGVVLLEATVSVALDVRVLLVTLHFHFEAVVRAEFIIGAKTTPPWELPPSDRRLQLAAPVVELSGAPFVIDPPQRPLVAAPITLPIRFVPQVSVGTTESGAPTVELIAMLLITTTGSDGEPSPFEHIVDGCFSWAVDIITGGAIGRSGPEADPELRRSDLTRLQRQLGSIYADLDDGPALHNGNRLTPEAVQTFWDQTFRYAVERWPAPAAEEDRSRYAYVPMGPRHTLDIRHDGTSIHHIDFSQHKPCSDGYQRWLAHSVF